MGPQIIARNYAETLFALANRHGGDPTVADFGAAIGEVAGLLDREPLIRDFLENPRIDVAAKQGAIEASFRGRVPELFLRFLLVVVQNRRQAVLPQIASAYEEIVDEAHGRTRAEVVLAREADEELRRTIVSSLEERIGGTVVASFRVDPSLIGGLVIRIGGEVLDGSVRRRTSGLRRSLLQARLPRFTAPTGRAGS